MPAGRPTNYTEDLGDLICEGIASGLSLVKICKADDMPEVRSVYRWRRLHDEFSQNYARSREDAADVFVQEIMEIADAAEVEDVQVAKLRVDTRKWTAARFNRAYQEKQGRELSGPNGMPIGVMDMSNYSDEELKEIASTGQLPKAT